MKPLSQLFVGTVSKQDATFQKVRATLISPTPLHTGTLVCLRPNQENELYEARPCQEYRPDSSDGLGFLVRSEHIDGFVPSHTLVEVLVQGTLAVRTSSDFVPTFENSTLLVNEQGELCQNNPAFTVVLPRPVIIRRTYPVFEAPFAWFEKKEPVYSVLLQIPFDLRNASLLTPSSGASSENSNERKSRKEKTREGADTLKVQSSSTESKTLA